MKYSFLRFLILTFLSLSFPLNSVCQKEESAEGSDSFDENGNFGSFTDNKRYVKTKDSINSYRSKENNLSIQFLGPFYLSSIGYATVRNYKNKMSLRFDFNIVGNISNKINWVIGPSLSQYVLFGNVIKPKLGFSEGAVFHPNSIKGHFNDREPWDRPYRTMFFASLDLGVEIPVIKDVLFISPEVNYALGYFKKFTPDFPNQLTFTSERLLSFGIDLKLKL